VLVENKRDMDNDETAITLEETVMRKILLVSKNFYFVNNKKTKMKHNYTLSSYHFLISKYFPINKLCQ